MKYIPIPVFFCLMHLTCFSQDSYATYSLEGQQLKGHVRSVRSLTQYAEQDSAGNSLYVIPSSSDWRSNFQVDYTDSGRISTVTFYAPGTNRPIQEHTFKYANGLLGKLTVYETLSDRAFGDTLVNNPTTGRHLSTKDARPFYEVTFAYDKQQRLTQERTHYEESGEVHTKAYDYRKNQLTITDKHGTDIRYEYDQQGRVIRETEFFESEDWYVFTMIYTEEGRVATDEFIEFPGEEDSERVRNVYTYRNGLVATIETSKSGKRTIKTMQYVFDDAGNWTQRTETSNTSKEMIVTKRIITYY